jgi:hypothetical protein
MQNKNLILALALAVMALFTPQRAEAAMDPLTATPVPAEVLNNLQKMAASGIRTPADAIRVVKTVAAIDASIAAYRALQAGTVVGSAAWNGYAVIIRNLGLTAEALDRGREMAIAAGYGWANLVGSRIISVAAILVPTDAMLQQLMYGEGYTPMYDSAMYDPMGAGGDLGGGTSTWFERVFDGTGGGWGEGSNSGGRTKWATWGNDPASDNPGPVPANYGAAAEAALSSGITHESEGPLGPIMLSAGYTPEAMMLGKVVDYAATALAHPLAYITTVNGIRIVTVHDGYGYATSFTKDGSMVRWAMADHLDFPF